MDKENPYKVMESKIIEEHLTQIAEVMEDKKLSALQFFGESLSEETKTKVAEFASLTTDNTSLATKVKDLETALETAKTSKEISPDTQKLAKISMDSVVAEIKAIDDSYPIDGILSSSLNEFEKIDMLGQVKAMATYSQTAINAVKEQIPKKDKVQGFGSPEDTDAEADRIVNELVALSGVKLE